MNHVMGYIFITLQVLLVLNSLYHTKKLLKDPVHRKSHIMHLATLQVATLVISALMIAHVLDAINGK